MVEITEQVGLIPIVKQQNFKEFSLRNRARLSSSKCFNMKFNGDSSLGAVSFQDCSLQIISTMLGDKLYEIKGDEAITAPVTAFAWKPIKGEGH